MAKRKTLEDKAMLALKEAVKKVVIEHRKDGRTLAVWENGKVKRISAKKAKKR